MSDTTTCAIVGGGPAGLFLGLMLARAGVDVTVLEKHADFLRDFRGDTVHPVTLRLLDELGLFERFDRLPHSVVEKGEFGVDGQLYTMVDFRRLHQPHPYVAMVPQWDLLDLIADAAQDEPSFTLRMQSEVTGLLRDGDKVTGVRYTGPDGPGELRTDLTVGCDGRTSVVRRDSGLPIRDYPVPFDVWWFRLPRGESGQFSLIPRTMPGRAVVMIPREDYFQIAYLIPKGSDAELRARGLESFQRELAELIPESSPAAITTWDDVKLLDVRLDRLRRWHDNGVLCIGDAAHAMSPVGGVGRHQSGHRRRRRHRRLAGGTPPHTSAHNQAAGRGASAPHSANCCYADSATRPASRPAGIRSARPRGGETACGAAEAAPACSSTDGCSRLHHRRRPAAPARAGLRPALAGP